MTHLVLKIKEVPSKTENGEKMTGHLRCRRSFQRTSEPVRQRPPLVSLSLRVFFTLQLNLSWRHSRSSLAWPLFFQLRPLQAWLASGAHSKAVGSTSASEGTGRFQSVKIDRTASLLKLRSTIILCSTIYWQFRPLTSIDRSFDLSPSWLSTRQDWKPRTKTRQCCADIRSPRAAKGWFFKRGYAGRVQALKAAAQRKHDQDDQPRRSEDAVDDHQGENSASSAVVEEFHFSRRYAVDLDLLSKSLQWTNTHCK